MVTSRRRRRGEVERLLGCAGRVCFWWVCFGQGECVVLCVQGEGMFVRAETNRGFCLCFVVFCCGVVRDVMWIAEETVQSRATNI